MQRNATQKITPRALQIVLTAAPDMLHGVTEDDADRRTATMQPLRFTLSAAYLASVRDMGDPVMIASAIRLFNAIRFPRTQPCTEADKLAYAEWCDL